MVILEDENAHANRCITRCRPASEVRTAAPEGGVGARPVRVSFRRVGHGFAMNARGARMGRALGCALGWTALGVAACGGSSPYDKAWLSNELGAKTGHEVREIATPDRAHPFEASLPNGIASTASLGEDDAVSVAVWNSAQLRSDLAQLGLSRADLADAAALPNPNLSFLFPIGTRQLELSAQYPVSQLISRPWRIAAAKLDVERVARGLVQSGLDSVRDVRISWAELEASGRRKQLQKRAAEIVAKSAELAQQRFVEGDVSILEADLVKAEAAAAADMAGRSQREENVARARLRMLLGLAESRLGEELQARPTEPSDEPPLELESLERTALASRPDVRAAELAVEAAGERMGLAKSVIVQIFARLDLKPVGPGGGSPILAIPGVGGELPIFSQNPGGRARATAELTRAAFAYTAARQQVVTDVRVAREELLMALASRAPWATTIVPLQEKNTAAAMRAYQSGGEAYLIVLEATRRLVDASLRALELSLDVRRARARLDRAVGWRVHASK